MLALIIEHWRAATPINRDDAEFAVVQAGFPYKAVRDSRYALANRRPPAIAIQNDVLAVPKLVGLIELGDAACIDDLLLLERIVAAIQQLYRPDRRQLTLEEVSDQSGVVLPDAQRLSPFTEIYGSGHFQLESHVLGWTSFEGFLEDRIGLPTERSPRVSAPPLPALNIDFLPTKLRWTNLGPYAEATMELSPLTVLVGGNDVGKTSALRIIELVRDLADRGLEIPTADAPPRAWIDLGRTGTTEFEIEIEGELRAREERAQQVRWGATFLSSPRVLARREWFVLEERQEVELEAGVGTWAGVDGRQEPLRLRPNQLALREARDPLKHASLIAMQQGMSRWISATDYSPLQLPYFELDQPKGLSSWRRLTEFPLDLQRLSGAVEAVLGAVKLELTYRGELLFRDRRGRSMPIAHAPSGIIQVVAILTALLQPNPPVLFAIDEIETHLHANVLERLLEVLRGFTHQTRIVLSTHSATVLRAMDPVEVRVVRAEGETSTLVRADLDPAFRRLVETGELGDLLEQGYFAGGV